MLILESIKADFEGDIEKSKQNEKISHEIDEFLLSLNPPNDFGANSDNNIVRHMEVSFEKLCASMEEAGINDPKNLTTFEFYSRLDYFQSKNKKR